ncbi:Uncharacterized protein TPS_09558 [Trichinella pseudospiralis]
MKEVLSAEAATQHTREVRASDNTSSNTYQIQARTAKQATICQTKVFRGKTDRQRKANFKRTANSLPYVDNLASRFPDSLLLDNLRPSAKVDQSCVFSRMIRGELVKVKGNCSLNVQYGNIHRTLTLIVAKGHCSNLLRFNWFEPLAIRPSGVHRLTRIGWKTILLDLDPNVTLICMEIRIVPFALREKIDAELDKLVEQGVLEPVDHHPVWSTPNVTPVKSDGTVRSCGDYKCTINKALRKHAYSIPAVSQLLASLSGGKVYAKLDLAQAYQQLTVDDATADAQTVITHRGEFRVKYFQFGISTAPGISQNNIDKTVSGIQRVLSYFNDILIAPSDEKELAGRLETVLHGFSKARLRLKSDKCKFCLSRVELLGFETEECNRNTS